MTIKLHDIFIAKSDKRLYTKQALFALKMSDSFINDIGVWLNLNYLESNAYECNLCFANNKEVRPEFRTVFTKTDIIHYVNALLNKDYFEIESDEVLFPINVTNFWESVKCGSQ